MVDNSNVGRGRGGQEQSYNHSFGIDLAHDFGGATLLSFPLLMTMEMWEARLRTKGYKKP